MAPLDFLITGADVYDGSTVEPQRLSVGIKGERIAYVGPAADASQARRLIHIPNHVLCPGFIDTHASTGLGYRFPHAGDNKLFQGITTEIIGNCGTSTAPVGDLLHPVMSRLADEIGFRYDWRSLGEWLGGVETYGLPFNIGTFVGHSTLRAGVCTHAQKVTATEIARMRDMVDDAMRDGALGLSTGLVYAPGSFATTGEIIELARVASRNGGIYVSHIRDERQNLEASIEEAIEIGREAVLPVLVSHLKSAERPNWGKIGSAINLIEAARRAGIRITFEVYPYAATSTKLRTFIPKDTLSDGVEGMVDRLRTETWREKSTHWLTYRGTDFDGMVLITESLAGATGKSIQQLAEMYGKDPANILVDVLIEDPDAWIVYHCMSQDDVDQAVLWPDSIICSDSWSYPVNAPKQIGNPHPRTFGAFTRFLERYSLQSERLPLGQAIRKITSLPAETLNLTGRGRIAEGYFADLVVLDPSNVRENATYLNPRQFSDGTRFVWVNGTLMLEDNKLYERKPGHIIRNQRGQ